MVHTVHTFISGLDMHIHRENIIQCKQSIIGNSETDPGFKR